MVNGMLLNSVFTLYFCSTHGCQCGKNTVQNCGVHRWVRKTGAADIRQLLDPICSFQIMVSRDNLLQARKH
jgi:hypothetical protein